jgi:hypothetical protein
VPSHPERDQSCSRPAPCPLSKQQHSWM